MSDTYSPIWDMREEAMDIETIEKYMKAVRKDNGKHKVLVVKMDYYNLLRLQRLLLSQQHDRGVV